MIGGDDIVIELRPGWGSDVMREFLVLMSEAWPQAIAEEDSDPIAVPLCELREDFREGFIYHSPEAMIDWTINGSTEHNGDSMVYVILKRRSMTLVVKCKSSPLGQKLCQFAQVWSGPIHP